MSQFELDSKFANPRLPSANKITGNFPPGATIRRDDVAKAFVTILEVNELLRDHLNANRLRQKFWIRMFADLIIDRTWDQL